MAVGGSAIQPSNVGQHLLCAAHRPSTGIVAPMHRTQRPLSITVAAVLIAIYGVLSLFRLAIYGSGLPASATGMAIWAVCIAGFAAIAWLLYSGSNVMRWFLALAVGASLVLFPIYKPEMPEGGLHLVLYVLQLALPVVACALTFTPQAMAWFKK